MGLKGTFLNPLIFIQQHFHTQIAQFNIVADRALIYSNLESGPKRFVRQRIFIFTICQTLSFSLVKLWNVLLSSSPKLSSHADCFNLENGLAVGEARVSIFCSTLHNHIITETNYALKFVKASTSSVSP